MKESVTIAKEADVKKDFSSTHRSDEDIHRVQHEPERQLGSLRSVINSIRHDGGTPSVESIATQLSSMHTAQRASALLALQSTHGNRYVQRVVAGIQAKLKVGQPGDVYEQEADRVAEPEVERQIEVEEELIPSKGISGNAPEVNDDLQARLSQSKGGGQPLPDKDMTFMESRFGVDFSAIRIHADKEAAQMAREFNAEAFTHGRDIYFGEDRYSPSTLGGKKLLAHELTHVLQQRRTVTGTPVKAKFRQERYRFGENAEQSRLVQLKTDTPRRVVTTVTIKRKNISLKGEDKYGHWWAEINSSESYGWWPKYPVGLWETLTGTDGELNGQTSFSGTPTKDPHHGDSADEFFYPTAPTSTIDATIKACMRKFAKSYSGEWRWILGWGQNCRTFQEDMMKKCDLQEK